MRPWEHRVTVAHLIVWLIGISILFNLHALWAALETSGYVQKSDYWYKALRLSSPYFAMTYTTMMLYTSFPKVKLPHRVITLGASLMLFLDGLQEIWEGIPESLSGELIPPLAFMLISLILLVYYKRWEIKRRLSQRFSLTTNPKQPKPKRKPYEKGEIRFRK